MEKFEKFGDYLDWIQQDKAFEKFYNLLQMGNAVCNLMSQSSIGDKGEVYIKHFLDSVLPERAFPEGANCIEVGSGGGFPSIPLMLMRKDLQFTMVESIQKKVNFLQNTIKKLDLPAVIINNRAEVLAHMPEYREKFDVCTARAVARMVTLVEYCLPLVKVGGRMIAYKMQYDTNEELKEAEYAIELLGGKVVDTVVYRLIYHNTLREAIVIEKVKNTPEKYPRGRGKERSKPLIKMEK